MCGKTVFEKQLAKWLVLQNRGKSDFTSNINPAAWEKFRGYIQDLRPVFLSFLHPQIYSDISPAKNTALFWKPIDVRISVLICQSKGVDHRVIIFWLSLSDLFLKRPIHLSESEIPVKSFITDNDLFSKRFYHRFRNSVHPTANPLVHLSAVVVFPIDKWGLFE